MSTGFKRQSHHVPGVIFLSPMARRLPAVGLDSGPAIGKPKRWCRIAAGGDEFEPFGVCDQMPRNPYVRDQLIVNRRLIVETKASAIMANRMNPSRHFDITAGPLRHAWLPPVRVIDRVSRVLRESVQNVGCQQF
jgi:hypothetical protein